MIDFGIAISGWMFFGRLLSLDDELSGGFYNPDGEHTVSKLGLAGLGLAFFGLVAFKL